MSEDSKSNYLNSFNDSYLSPPETDGNPFFEALVSGDNEQIKKLATVSNVNVRNSQGLTPIMLTTLHGTPETLELLVSLGGDMELSYDLNGGVTAIFMAEMKPENVLKLIDLGANLLHRRNCGLNFAHYAASILCIPLLKTVVAKAPELMNDTNFPLRCTPAAMALWNYARSNYGDVPTEVWNSLFELLVDNCDLSLPMMEPDAYTVPKDKYAEMPSEVFIKNRGVIGFAHGVAGNFIKCAIEHPEKISIAQIDYVINKCHLQNIGLSSNDFDIILSSAILNDNDVVIDRLASEDCFHMNVFALNIFRAYDSISLAAAAGAIKCLQMFSYIHTKETTVLTQSGVVPNATPAVDEEGNPVYDASLSALDNLMRMTTHSPLHECIQHQSSLLVLSHLLSSGFPVDFDYNGYTPLILACLSSQWSQAKMLVAYGANPLLEFAAKIDVDCMLGDKVLYTDTLSTRSPIGICLAMGDSGAPTARYLLDKAISRGLLVEVTRETMLGSRTIDAWGKLAQKHELTEVGTLLTDLLDGKVGVKSEDEKARFEQFRQHVRNIAADPVNVSGVPKASFSTFTPSLVPSLTPSVAFSPRRLMAPQLPSSRLHGLSSTLSSTLVKNATRLLRRL